MKKGLTLIAALFLSQMAWAQPTMVTAYNAEGLSGGSGSGIVVLRQNSKVKLLVCNDEYKGALSSNPDMVNYLKTCVDYDKVQNSGFAVSKNYIANDNSGVPRRAVVTGAGATLDGREVDLMSDVTTWTIDIYKGEGVPSSSSVLLIGSRVTHDRLKNPAISTYRQTYLLKGLAGIDYPEIVK